MNLAVFMPSSWQNGVWLVLLVLSRTLAASSPEDVVLEPGMQPLDKTGKKVEAHGGMIYVSPDKTFYWVGEGGKEGCLGNPPAYSWDCEPQTLEMSDGINIYSSANLKDWEFQTQALRIDTVPEPACAPQCRLERPKVVRDPATGKFIMLFHISKPDLGDPNIWSAVGVASADNIVGPWSYVTSFLPNGLRSWDMNVFQEDGVTYLVRAMGSGPESRLTISPLLPNYTAADAPVARAARGEGPAMFKANGQYYLLFSGITWWEPNQAGLARSTSLRPADGSFPSVVPPVDGTGGSTTYDSQPTYVLPFPCDNGRTVLIYMGDRWNVRGPGGLANASYVWLPLLPREEDPSLYHIVYRQSWSPSEYCNEAPHPDSLNMPLVGPMVAYRETN